MTTPWIDISVPLFNGMAHWPGDPDVRITRIQSIDQGDTCNVSTLALSVHTGTHMDAPLHFIQDGQALDTLPFDATVGPVRVIEIHDPESIKVAELAEHHIQPQERILFKTRNSTNCWQSQQFVEDFVYISREAARFLAEQQIQTVGVDYLSVGGFVRDGVETHLALLGSGIWIIEGLNLAQVEPGHYELVCLPLKIVNADGAPARAILRATTNQ